MIFYLHSSIYVRGFIDIKPRSLSLQLTTQTLTMHPFSLVRIFQWSPLCYSSYRWHSTQHGNAVHSYSQLRTKTYKLRPLFTTSWPHHIACRKYEQSPGLLSRPGISRTIHGLRTDCLKTVEARYFILSNITITKQSYVWEHINSLYSEGVRNMFLKKFDTRLTDHTAIGPRKP